MSLVDIIYARPRTVGGFSVRRTLPSMTLRMVGPFIFWDHMGPVHLDPGQGIDVRPHPHIELATVTYLFEGEIVHKDSLGSDQAIRPGDVNWMTAGRGIAHSERSGPEARRLGPALHGIQSWVALPAEHELTEPSFQHVDAAMLPAIDLAAARLRVIAGTAYGETSPVRVLSPLFYVEARLDAGAELVLPSPEEHAERAAYVVEGAVDCAGERLEAGTMGVVHPTGEAAVRALAPSRVMLLGGAPVGPRHIWWNFVSSSEARIDAAKRRWKERAFPRIPGDDFEDVPLPER